MSEDKCGATDILAHGIGSAIRADCTKPAGHIERGDLEHWDMGIQMGWED